MDSHRNDGLRDLGWDSLNLAQDLYYAAGMKDECLREAMDGLVKRAYDLHNDILKAMIREAESVA